MQFFRWFHTPSKARKANIVQRQRLTDNIPTIAIRPLWSAFTDIITVFLSIEPSQKNPKNSFFCLICSPVQVNSPEGVRVI